MNNFRVGQKVRCVKPHNGGFHILPVCQPFVGEEYTIRGLSDNGIGLYLQEITNPISPQWGVEYGFLKDRFRPLITPEQDIALFHALCPGLPVVPPAVVPKRVPVTSPSD